MSGMATLAPWSVRGSRRAAGLILLAAVPVLASITTAVPVRAQSPPGPQPNATVPVTVTQATRKDVPIWLRGLGTVQANYSAQIRSRVDGTLMQVAVKEGQDVKQGDLLAVIDPRPYQAALDAGLARNK